VRALRPGGYASMSCEASAAAAVPSRRRSARDAALGLASVTAFEDCARSGISKAADRRTGCAGGVGSAAVAIAKAQGAQVVGIISRPEQAA